MTASTSADPWSFSHFLKAGTIVLKVSPALSIPCDHSHAEDGWHKFLGQSALGFLHNSEDDELCRVLDYLSTNQYIRTTLHYNRSDKIVLVRVYIIPFDLSNVQGRLRVRKDGQIAKQYLRQVFRRTLTSPNLWDGQLEVCNSPLLPDETDIRTLAEIYSDLPSPEPPTSSEHWRFHRLEDENGLGLRSSLYSYQRRSVFAMIEQETNERDVPDPCYIPLRGIDGTFFHFQPGTMEILRDQPRVEPTNGGLLCEELGTGKTVMVLSLILSNLREISKPEPSIVDPRPVLTPLSLSCFPSGDFEQARGRLQKKAGKQANTIPSLVELLLHQARTHPHALDPEVDSADSPLFSTHFPVLLKANNPFYYHYSGDPTDFQRTSRRDSKRPAPRQLYLTSATMIVVPGTLVEQWYREIQKHVEIPLRVLRVGVHDVLPSVQSLASDYDIILLSYQRLTSESQRAEMSKLHSVKACKCPLFPNTRVPNCSCQAPDVTPLLQIRWKRLVIDEGHVSGMLNSVSTTFARLLSVQHRWIVTGTPTTNLLGLSFGSQSQASSTNDFDESPMSVDEEDFESPSLSADEDDHPTILVSPQSPSGPRIWNKHDAEDLHKLGNMISSFIAVPHFAHGDSAKLLRTQVKEPLMDKNGPRPRSIEVLTRIMGMVMVRHRIEDVEKDVLLPPLRHDSVLLDLDPYAARSYNMLQTVIVINAVDSERKDQDYLFHPSNMDSLQLLVRNMSQVLFWRVDDTFYNVDEIVARPEDLLKRAGKHNVSADDLELLQQAIKEAQSAAADTTWRQIQTHEDIPFRTTNINVGGILAAWSRITTSTSEDLVHPDRLLKLRYLVKKRPLISLDAMIDAGEQTSKLDRLQRAHHEASQASSKKNSKEKKTRNETKEEAGNKSARSSDTLKEMKAELSAALKKMEDFGNDDSINDLVTPTVSATSYQYDSSLIRQNHLANARLGLSASSKLNWILNEVLKYSKDDKFLIFSDSDLTLAHISEALALFNVRFLRFTSAIPPGTREQVVLTFETSETYRVFLMSLKHGARGLNLVSASRVIFCEPVWQADVENQAIKRVHRIGQTKPVVVKTLAIRGTQEEAMVARRNSLLDKQGKVPKLLEEAGMRHFISHPKFLEPASASPVTLDFPLFNLPPAPPPKPVLPDAATVHPSAPAPHASIPRPGTIKLPSLNQLAAYRSTSVSKLPAPEMEQSVSISVDIDHAHPMPSASGNAAEGQPVKKRRVVNFAV